MANERANELTVQVTKVQSEQLTCARVKRLQEELNQGCLDTDEIEKNHHLMESLESRR